MPDLSQKTTKKKLWRLKNEHMGNNQYILGYIGV